MKGRDRWEVAKDEMVWRDRIRNLLLSGPRTVPAVARELEQPASDVMAWMMSLRKYGLIAESEEADAEGFYKYRWTGKDS
jgi:predicted transcriptional regulator